MITNRQNFKVKCSLDNVDIKNTRARHNDTVYVSISLKIGSNDPITKTQAMGDLNNGTYPVGLSVEGVIPDGVEMPVVFSYLIVNSGHANPTALERGAEAALAALGSAAANAATSAANDVIVVHLGPGSSVVIPLVDSAIKALTSWLVSKIGSILFANCDGVVATGVRVFSSRQLIQNTASGHKITETVKHPGSDSPWGCGSNSVYFTNTTISTVPVAMPLPPVILNPGPVLFPV